jgi:Na+/phosphate symporter
MLTIILPLLVAVVGALMYALAANAKLAELGRILFFVGAFFCVWVASGKVLAIGPVR